MMGAHKEWEIPCKIRKPMRTRNPALPPIELNVLAKRKHQEKRYD